MASKIRAPTVDCFATVGAAWPLLSFITHSLTHRASRRVPRRQQTRKAAHDHRDSQPQQYSAGLKSKVEARADQVHGDAVGDEFADRPTEDNRNRPTDQRDGGAFSE